MRSQSKTGLASVDFWLRLLYILLFALAWQVTELFLIAVAVLQIACRALNGEADSRLAGFGNSLSQYAWQIGRFVTGVTDQKPWPFMEWPRADARWEMTYVVPESETGGETKARDDGQVKP